MDVFGIKAKADECRLLASDARGERREKLLALADEFDSIHEGLVRLVSQQTSVGSDEPVMQIPKH